MASLLVTGASGFVGFPACHAMQSRGFSVYAFSRTPCKFPTGVKSYSALSLSDIHSSSLWLEGIDCVLHLAGRAHVMHETEPDALTAYRNVNVYETLKLARHASLAGVRRFVFVSSIKVNGEFTSPFSPFTEETNVNPVDPYGISKYEAECGLLELAAETGMEVVIVRPPLIYGPGVKGNFKLMKDLLALNLPLPFASITDNRRSYLGLDNFIDFLVLCLSHSDAAGRVFLVSDQHDLSTAELLRRLSCAMDLSPSLFPVPKSFLRVMAGISLNYSMYQRLCGSLAVDSSAASRLLGWTPPVSLDEGLRRSVVDFIA